MGKRKRAPQVAGPLTALQEQVALVNWWESETGEAFGDNFYAIEEFKGRSHHGTSLGEIESYKLDRARTYYVTSDMQALIASAAESMPEQALAETDLPSPYGFVWFEDLIEQWDANGQAVTWRAMAWRPAEEVQVIDTKVVGRGVQISYYTDLLNHGIYEFGGDYEFDMRRWLNDGNPRLLMLHENGWIFGKGYADRDKFVMNVGVEVDDETKAMMVDSAEFWTRRFVAATWAIMGQKIASQTRQHIPKTMERPLYNRPVPAELVYVDLRKTVRPSTGSGESEREVVWNHRWIVRGFWRNQYLPSTGTHRLQWIHDFVKGPAGLPLVVKEQVYRVRR